MDCQMRESARTIATCAMIISGIPIINFACFVLCLIINIVISIATEPPRAESKRSVRSLVRCFVICFDAILS